MRRAWLLALLAAGCGGEPAPGPSGAPLTPRASLVFEPTQVGVGQVAVLELAVLTPPQHVPLPWSPPRELPGVWLLDAEPLEPERRPGRWLHRTRLRVRGREAGRFVWPAGRVEVEAPDGARSELALPALPFEVVSVLPEHPDRMTPFGVLRPEPAPASQPGPWGPAAAGAAAALAAVALLTLARRRRERAPAPPPAGPAPPPVPWVRARADLEDAQREAPADAFAAAHRIAIVLRRYLSQRFGEPLRGLTSEELAGRAPPFALTTRWPTLVGLLRDLDALRFRDAADPGARTALERALPGLAQRAMALVDDTTPPEARR